MTPPRTCAHCGASLEGRDPRAEVCSPRCRIERSTLRRLAAGERVGPYRSVAQYEARRRVRRSAKRSRAA